MGPVCGGVVVVVFYRLDVGAQCNRNGCGWTVTISRERLLEAALATWADQQKAGGMGE